MRYQILALLVLLSSVISAQTTESAKDGILLGLEPIHVLMIIFVIIVSLVLMYFWYITEVLLKSYRSDIMNFKGIPIEERDTTTVFDKLRQKAWNIVPVEKESSIDLGHDYDGIRELDNRLPPWWLYLFYFTIAWGGIYLYVYHFSDIGRSQHEVYEEKVTKAEYQRLVFLEEQANAVNENNVVAITNDTELGEYKEIYLTNCASCHGQMGEGGIGPNLTDPYWIHGGGIKNVFSTIKYGVPEKGMIAWREQMQPKTMQGLASYILTLEGSNPPNAKEPQGKIYEPESE